MKTLIRLAMITSLILFSGHANARDEIAVATVNGEVISLEDVMAAAQEIPPEYRQAPMETYFDQLVAELIDTHLAADAARAAKLDDDEAVTQAIERAVDRVLAQAFLTATVNEEITEEAINNAYQALVADTASRETVTASHILVESRDAAMDIIAKLNDGGDFAALAKEFSTGPSGPNGGELGSFGRGQMVPAFETAVFAMPVGSFSAEPVQTQFGWHIIKVANREVQPAPEIDAVRGQLVSNLQRQVLGRMLESLRAKANVEQRSFDDIRADVEAADKAASGTN